MKAKSINKRLIAIVAIIALTSILAVCLVACNNQDTFEKRMKDKDYVVISMSKEQLESTVGEDVGEVEWAILATKGNALSGEGDYVGIIKFKNESDAKDCASETLAEFEEMEIEGFTVARDGKIVFIGTTQAVEDAKK